jgi:DNA end-binding protein Ku
VPSSSCTRGGGDDEIRDPSELTPAAVDLTDEEIEDATLLMDRLARDGLEGEEFTDRYTEPVEQLIEAKREHKEPPRRTEESEAPGQVVDLMAAFKEAVAKAQASRGEDATVHDLPKRTTARKTTKKAPAEKVAKKAAKKQRGA